MQNIQIQNNLIKRIRFISSFRYLLPILLLFGIVIKEPEKFVKSKFNIKQNDNYNDHNKKKEKKKKVVKERKKKLQRRT